MSVKAISVICATVASIGVAVTAYFAVKCTPKAEEALKQAEEEKHDDLTNFEKVQVAAPEYKEAIIAGAVTVTAIVVGTGVGIAGIAAATAACAGIASKYRTELNQYSKTAKDIFGKYADAKIRSKMTEKEHPNPEVDHSEERLFRIWDGETDIYFWSTLEKVLTAELELNEDFQLNKEVTIRDFFDLLGVEFKASVDMGWSVEMCNEMYDLPFITITHEEVKPQDDEPDNPGYINIVFRTEPACGYNNGCYEDYLTHKEFIDADISA